MSLRTRLVWLTGSWILIILIFFNIFIYYYTFKKTTSEEDRLLWNKAQIILRNPDIHNPRNWSRPDLLQEFGAEDTLIRIIGASGRIRAQLSSNEELSAYPAVYRTGYQSTVVNDFDSRKLFIQVPIISENTGTQIGLLELGKELDFISSVLDILVTGLTITTISIILFSIIAAVFYTRVIIRPLRQLLETMRAIRSSGDFVLLDPKYTSKKDELGRLGQTFNEMILFLQDTDQKQKQFVADASHELRTPLTVIESYASLLKRWGGNDPAVREEAIEAIHSESARLKSLITSLLKLAEVEREELMNCSDVELIPLVKQAAEQMEHAFQRQIELFCPDEEERPIVLCADREKLKQLLIILIDNAFKYSKEPVKIDISRVRHHVQLQIIDRGMGIPKDELPHLFERFYRVDKARGRGTGGTGLGLSIAKQIVTQHRGTIHIDSKIGVGTTVTIGFQQQK
ncbi:sensor histidine kinase [Paenibacillus cremeus]|uniref:histidine kinase n=1 Tax=Paenibacillus cremeus TaxID=2163881 RepID=A0A559K541_9BACL|nr:HAMP domain-containing sensor histidine kinase [Paenibacillus cremeus]TVY07255.1 HAMP domain-containing histidine kinase [Paenibacillus cremeus]